MDAKTSFDGFVLDAWNILQAEEARPVAERRSVSLVLWELYDSASAPTGPIKDPLTGDKLYRQMAAFIGNTAPAFGAPLKMRLQGLPNWDLNLQAQDIIAYYNALADGTAGPPTEAWQERAIGPLAHGYLHVYPPPSDTGGNWRIALNVVPDDIAKAVGLCRALMELPSAIDHIKFLAPGETIKCDTVLCYLTKDESYPELRAQFRGIADQLTLQPCVGRMWDEDPDKPGFGEASEPPKEHGVYRSFTAYRCLVVYLAYKTFEPDDADGDRFEKFKTHLAGVMTQFGMDFAQPHLQTRPLPDSLTGECKHYLESYLKYKNAWGRRS